MLIEVLPFMTLNHVLQYGCSLSYQWVTRVI